MLALARKMQMFLVGPAGETPEQKQKE